MQTEHLWPEVAHRLEEEGVADPDRLFAALLEDFTGQRTAGGRTPSGACAGR